MINRQVRMEDGDIARQLTAAIVHSGITLRELVRSNFDETWSHDSELRETFINLTPISPGLFDQVFQPTPGTMVTILHQSRAVSPLEEPQRLPDEPSEPSDDEFVMMQQGASISTPSERTQAPFVVHIFARRNRHTAFESETLDQMRDQVVEQWELPLTGDMSIAALHTIAFPPHFVTGSDTLAFIVEHRGDAVFRANVDDVLIVVQIRFQHVRTRFVKDRVHVAWAPKIMSRRSMLSFLRARQFCFSSGVGCYLQINGRDWPDEESTRHLEDGDYIHLLIDSRTDHWCDLQRSERIQRRQHFYESSDYSRADDDSRISRSRSRSLSLLQTKAKLTQTPYVPLKQDSVPDVVHPHVFDLWCDAQSQDAIPCSLHAISDNGTQFPGYTEGNMDLSSGRESSKNSDSDRPPLRGISNLPGPCDPIEVTAEVPTWCDIPFDGNPSVPTSEEPPQIEIPFRQVIIDFEWMDAHFLLPSFQRDDIAWHPNSVDWMALPWMMPDSGCIELWLYFDGSSIRQTQAAGAGVVAFARTHYGWGLCGFVSTTLATDTDSFQAEAAAALIAVKLAHDLTKMIQAHGGAAPELHLVFDNSTVGQQAVGNWTCKSRPDLGKAVRHLVQMTERRFGSKFHTHHVYGHRGDPGNEIVDTLARYAAEGTATDSLCDFVEYQITATYLQSSAWFWMLFRQDLHSYWKEQSLFVPAHPVTCPSKDLLERTLNKQEDVHLGVGHLHLKLATANVLSLKAGSKKAEHDAWGPARQELLLRQFFDHEFQIVAMQETRLCKLWKSIDDRYIILKSAATDRGHFGIAACFSTTIPHGTVSNNDGSETKICFTPKDLSIVAEDPRFLIVRAQTVVLKCLVLACHAPHSGADEETRSGFWSDISEAIPKKYHSWDIILLGDLNCRLGEEVSEAIGPYQSEVSNGKEHSCHEFLLRKGICLPATFSGFQVGGPGTWQHTNGQWLRNDFVGIPAHWRPWKCRTWVEDRIDLALTKTDHCVAALSLELIFAIQHKIRHRTKKISEGDLDYIGEEPWWALPPPVMDWHTDVHTHAHSLQENLQSTLAGYKCKRPAKPKKSTLSAETWTLVCQKKEARLHLASLNRQQRQTYLAMCFHIWASPANHHPQGFCTILANQDCLIAQGLKTFRDLGRQVTRETRRDDSNFYTGLSEEASDFLDPRLSKKFWQVIRRSLPQHQSRRVGHSPYQFECLEEQWDPHFQALEIGSTASSGDLVRDCHAFQVGRPHPTVINLDALPTLAELEDVFRETRANKSTGYDQLPFGLFHKWAPHTANYYFDLVWKMFAWRSEPIGFKGGNLAVIPKRGDMMLARNYRGILLLPSVPKRIHALLRRKIMAKLEPARYQGQIGGFPRQQVAFGSQAIRTFTNVLGARGYSTTVLFVDLAEAFHRLVRELMTGVGIPQYVDILLKHLEDDGLPTSGLRDCLEQPDVLYRLGCDPLLQEFVQDIHYHTWFTVSWRRAGYGD